jgi:hypothetical protein
MGGSLRELPRSAHQCINNNKSGLFLAGVDLFISNTGAKITQVIKLPSLFLCDVDLLDTIGQQIFKKMKPKINKKQNKNTFFNKEFTYLFWSSSPCWPVKVESCITMINTRESQ